MEELGINLSSFSTETVDGNDAGDSSFEEESLTEEESTKEFGDEEETGSTEDDELC